MSNQTHPSDRSDKAAFATTRWSVVIAAGHRKDPVAEAALAGLCDAYWLPLYEFARRRGYSAADAGDVTQGFFAQLLEKEFLQSVDPERGRFRSFLLTAFKRFLSKERDHHRALKRGGTAHPVSLDVERAESRFRIEPIEDRTPESLFERRWAIMLLDRVLSLLEAEFQQKGKQQFFTMCRGCLTGLGMDEQYVAIATACGMTEAAVKVAVHRMRARYRELLLAEIAQTVASEADVEDELRALMNAVRG